MKTQPGEIVNLLDHGYVRYVDGMGSDLSVVRAARNSFNAAWRAGEDESADAKLIRYLWRNKHTTPFEHVVFTFDIKAPIFVFRQWHRHRTWSYSEVSARYSELPEEFYLPNELHIQSTVNKQGRDDSVAHGSMGMLLAIEKQCCDAFALYTEILRSGVSREEARMHLPLNTYTKMFGTTNLLNLLKFIVLRSDAHAQYEIRVYSDAILDMIRTIVPECVAAFEA